MSYEKYEVYVFSFRMANSEIGFYAGYTSDFDARKITHENKEKYQGIQFLPEIKELFGKMSKADARAVEGYLSHLIISQSFTCEGDGALFSESSDNAIVNESACKEAWESSRFVLKEGELLSFKNKIPCTTEHLNDLLDKVNSISRAHGTSIPGGRFALNSSREIIRRIVPAHGVDSDYIFSVALDSNGKILTHDSEIYFADGEVVPLFGSKLTSDDFYKPAQVDIDKFSKFEQEVIRIIRKAAKN